MPHPLLIVDFDLDSLGADMYVNRELILTRPILSACLPDAVRHQGVCVSQTQVPSTTASLDVTLIGSTEHLHREK